MLCEGIYYAVIFSGCYFSQPLGYHYEAFYLIISLVP